MHPLPERLVGFTEPAGFNLFVGTQVHDMHLFDVTMHGLVCETAIVQLADGA